MKGSGIILSNRHKALLESMENFGDSIQGIRKAQQDAARQAKMDGFAANADTRAQEAHAAGQRQAANQDALQGFALRRAGEQEQDASALRSNQAELAAVDSGLTPFGPRMPADETPTPFADQNRNLRARLMASIETQQTGKPVRAQDIFDREDAAKVAKAEEDFDRGEKKNKAGRDAAKSAQEIAESKARESNYYADAAKQKNAKPDLPADVKAEVAGLSGKNAGKISIANQIGSYLEQFRAAETDDGKVRIGRQMLKVLNSPEGADAIGVEEAKRLGDALEYNVADVGAGLGVKTGKFHGRDLEGFESQAQATYDAIRGSVNANRAEVDRLMGRDSAPAASPKAKSWDTLDDSALDAQLRAKGIDPATGKRLTRGANGSF